MRATLAIAVLFALAAPFCCLAAEQQPDLDKLIARADAAGEQKAELYARVVEAEVAAAEHHFAEGESDAAFASVDAVNDYSDKCLAAAQQHARKLKQAEIALRQSARRLHDVEQSLEFENRPKVKAAVQHLDDIRSKLLQIMFAPPHKK